MVLEKSPRFVASIALLFAPLEDLVLAFFRKSVGKKLAEMPGIRGAIFWLILQ